MSWTSCYKCRKKWMSQWLGVECSKVCLRYFSKKQKRMCLERRVYIERKIYMGEKSPRLNYFLLLFVVIIDLSHGLHTRWGSDHPRSGTGCLPGEHSSQTPCPHFRLENHVENKDKFKCRERELPTNGVCHIWYYWMVRGRHNRRDTHHLVANSSAEWPL